jgi:regulator of chromosome condensation
MNTLIEQFEENHLHDSVVNVYVWGSAECDQFELKDEDGEDISESKRPIAVSMPVRVVSVACGGLHTLFLTDGG